MQSRLGLRPLWLAAIFAAVFVLWTTSPSEWRRQFSPLGQGEPFWTEAKSAGLTAEYRRLWGLRSRRGGLVDSAGRLESIRELLRGPA